MVGGDDYSTAPFNLATQGQRQPGSAFKPFVLAAGAERAASRPTRPGPRARCRTASRARRASASRRSRSTTTRTPTPACARCARRRRSPTTPSTRRSASRSARARSPTLARRMGIRTPVSHNFAMTLGGLKQGVTPLDMAHAYETFAAAAAGFTYGTMSPGAVDAQASSACPSPGPVGIRKIGKPDDGKLEPVDAARTATRRENETRDWPVLKPSVADQVSSILSTVVTQRHGVRAQIPGTFVAGKTGTTENYGDAWFVGWTQRAHGRGLGRLSGRAARRCRPSSTASRSPAAPTPRRSGRRSWRQARTYEDYGTRTKDPERARSRRRRRRPRTPGTPAPTAPAPGAARRPRRAGDGGGTAPRSPRPSAGAGARAARAGAAGAAGDRRARRAAARRRATGGRRRPRADRATPGARPPRAAPAGHGRETLRDPVAQKRHSQLGRLRDPDARADDDLRRPPSPAAAGRSRTGPRDEVGGVELELDRRAPG